MKSLKSQETISECASQSGWRVFEATLRFVVDVLIFNRKGTLDAGFLDNVTCLNYMVQLLGKSDQVAKIPLLVTLRNFSLMDGELDPQEYFGDLTSQSLGCA